MDKHDSLAELSEIIGTKNRFSSSTVRLTLDEIEDVVRQLKEYSPRYIDVSNNRPMRMKKASEKLTNYRLRVCRLIFEKSGIIIRPSSLTSVRFYNEIADYVFGEKIR
jgi:hypothetical protein